MVILVVCCMVLLRLNRFCCLRCLWLMILVDCGSLCGLSGILFRVVIFGGWVVDVFFLLIIMFGSFVLLFLCVLVMVVVSGFSVSSRFRYNGVC